MKNKLHYTYADILKIQKGSQTSRLRSHQGWISLSPFLMLNKLTILLKKEKQQGLEKVFF